MTKLMFWLFAMLAFGVREFGFSFKFWDVHKLSSSFKIMIRFYVISEIFLLRFYLCIVEIL